MTNYKKIIAIITGAVILDQITKGYMLWWASRGQIPLMGDAWELVRHPYIMERVTSFFNLVFTWNPGMSFSIGRGLGMYNQLFIIALTGVIIGWLIHFLFSRSSAAYEKLPLALIVGGALGNFIDRLRFGAVIDFLDFHAFGIHWPAFNVADIFIVTGAMLYVVVYFINRRK